MMPFEKRVARLEAARNMRFQGRQVADEFQHRVTAEARKLGSKLVSMTRQRFDEIAARIKEEI